jgi:Glycosyl transferase family 2
MANPVRKAVRKAYDSLTRPHFEAVHARVAELQAKVDHIDRRLDFIHADIHAGTREVGHRSDFELARMDELGARIERLERFEAILKHLDDDKASNRRRLYELRESADYDLAFTEADPLVSFVVATYNRFEKLRDVALPSMLGQTHANVEVIVVGDAAPPETAAAIESIGDPRVRYYNRPVRGPYPDDKSIRWYMLGTPPFNDGLSMVRGRWIAGMADDDAVRPDFIQTLLSRAREGRFENCYGRHQVHYKSGEVLDLGGFPPRKGEFVTQAAIYHSGLRFFQMSFADPLFEEPNDWALCRRMMDAGVRYGMVDAVVFDKYESRFDNHAGWDAGVPSVD